MLSLVIGIVYHQPNISGDKWIMVLAKYYTMCLLNYMTLIHKLVGTLDPRNNYF